MMATDFSHVDRGQGARHADNPLYRVSPRPPPSASNARGIAASSAGRRYPRIPTPAEFTAYDGITYDPRPLLPTTSRASAFSASAYDRTMPWSPAPAASSRRASHSQATPQKPTASASPPSARPAAAPSRKPDDLPLVQHLEALAHQLTLHLRDLEAGPETAIAALRAHMNRTGDAKRPALWDRRLAILQDQIARKQASSRSSVAALVAEVASFRQRVDRLNISSRQVASHDRKLEKENRRLARDKALLEYTVDQNKAAISRLLAAQQQFARVAARAQAAASRAEDAADAATGGYGMPTNAHRHRRILRTVTESDEED